MGGRDNIEPALRLAENGINLFQRSISGLWIKEVDDWNDEGISRFKY